MEANNNLNFEFGQQYEQTYLVIEDVYGKIRTVNYVFTRYYPQDCATYNVPYWMKKMRYELIRPIRHVLN